MEINYLSQYVQMTWNETFYNKSNLDKNIEITKMINPFMHNVQNGQTYFKNLAVFSPQDF